MLELVVSSDDGRIRIGTGFDFEFYHDGSHSIINDSAGSLLVRSNVVQISTPAGSKYFKGQNGIANLYYSDSKKLETSAKELKLELVSQLKQMDRQPLLVLSPSVQVQLQLMIM